MLGNISQAAYTSSGSTVKIETYTLFSGGAHAGMNRLQKIEFDMDGSGGMGNTVDYTVSYDWDANGNMSERMVTMSDGSTDGLYYTYDFDDRLIKVEDGATIVAEYLYDPFGRRVLKDTGSDVEVYFYDREDVVAEWDGATVKRRYVHGPGVDDYVAMVDVSGGENYFYHTDGLGSVTEMVAEDGDDLSTRYQYAPFGMATVLTGATVAAKNPYEYTGRRYDSETGLMYYRSRYYDPAQRRFAQEDVLDIPLLLLTDAKYIEPNDTGVFSISDFMGKKSKVNLQEYLSNKLYLSTFLNQYAYCLNNPINFKDPFGMSFDVLSVLGTVLLGAGALIMIGAAAIVTFPLSFAFGVAVLVCGAGYLVVSYILSTMQAKDMAQDIGDNINQQRDTGPQGRQLRELEKQDCIEQGGNNQDDGG